jgi:hypothetical protein
LAGFSAEDVPETVTPGGGTSAVSGPHTDVGEDAGATAAASKPRVFDHKPEMKCMPGVAAAISDQNQLIFVHIPKAIPCPPLL